MPFKDKDQYRKYQRDYHRRYKKIRRGERTSLDNLKGDPVNFEPIRSDISQIEHNYYRPKRSFWQKLFGNGDNEY